MLYIFIYGAAMVAGASTIFRNRYSSMINNIRILAKSKYQQLIPKYTAKIMKFGNTHFEVRYTIGGREFRMIATPPRGPQSYYEIRNQDDDDVTDIVEKYIGPAGDWHGSQLTPAFFGYTKLTFVCDEDYEFSANETIPPLKELNNNTPEQYNIKHVQRPNSA